MMKAIFHIDESNRWTMLINNIKNFLSAVELNNIKVLANGPAVREYLEDNKDLIQLMERGVLFMACNNSMKVYEIDPKDIDSRIKIVPVGVVELVSSQNDGYRYIKP